MSSSNVVATLLSSCGDLRIENLSFEGRLEK